ncbi:serine-rich adhesin for platelets-like [Eleutherodactylus coqui]|uniref:serine-rich adhesin for platelets-like n=1 Tax=Eleutherodactylus coqui TaxID=57060 RepID=UPI0034623742
MPSCVVRGCGHAKKKTDPSRILHGFPREPEKIKLWLLQTGQYGIEIDEMVVKVYLGKVYDTYRMCSLHFTDDSYHYDGYRRILRKDALPTIFDSKQSTVPSITIVSANIPSVSGSSSSSSKQHIFSFPPTANQKQSDSGAVCTYRVEFPVVNRKASSQSTIQQMTLVPVHPQPVIFKTCEISQKSNSVVSSRSVTIQPTATTTMCKATQMQSVLSVVSPQSSVSTPSTSSILEVPVSSSSSSCVQQSTSAVSGLTSSSSSSSSSHGGQGKKPVPANLQKSASASVIFLQNSSTIITNSSLPLDTKPRTEATSSSTKTLYNATSSCPIISLCPASSQVIPTSGFNKPPHITMSASPISIPLTVVSETKPCSIVPVSGNASSVTQSTTTSGLAQKPPSISVVHIPLKTPTSQTAIVDCPPSSKKRKLEENIVSLERSTPSSSKPSILPSPCTSQTSVNTGKLYFVPSSAPLPQRTHLIQKPLMVDKSVNTDFFTNRKSCCVATDHMYRRRNAQTQTKMHRRNRKIMCTLLLPSAPTDSESTVSLASPEHTGISDCSPSRSSDDGYDPHEVLEKVNLDLVKVEILSDSEMDVSVPTINKKQAIHSKEEYKSSAGQAVLFSTPFIPHFDITKMKIEPNIKTKENQFPISPSSKNPTHFLFQNPKVEKISHIKSEPLAPVYRNPTSWETSAVQTDDEPEELNDSAFHIDELSEDEDESFLVPSDAEDEDDIKYVFQDLDSPVENPVEEEKYIVFESCLKKLIMMIPCMSKTKCMSPLTQYRKETTGSHLSIEVRCSSGHTSLLWESQPRHGYQPLGNVLLSAAVLFSGSSFLKSQHMFKLLNLKSIDKTTHHKNQYMYLFPAISHHWKEEQKEVIRGAQERPLCLAGDQQLDKPGYSAKYSIYSLLDVASKKICSFSVEPVNPQVTLDCLEKTGFQKAMDELQIMNVDVKMIVTDRSVAIQEVLKDNYPNILHRVDMWHLSKSIGNEVLMAAKHKDCEILYQWVEAIRNHIWWSSHTCCRNPDLLIQKWKSVIQHVSNVHEWDGDSDCKACHHPPLPEDVVNSTNWLQKDSAAYEQLKKIVENTSLLSDLKQLSFSCHTGELEIYHGTCLKYRPKTLHFFMDSMVARTQLAALDHNRNVHRVKAEVQNASSGDDLDTMTQKLDACKGQRSWITKALYKPIYQNFLFDIMNDVIAFVREEKTFN